MRPGAEDPVRADELKRVRCNRAHGVVGRVVENHGHVERRLEHQADGRRDRVRSPPRGDRRQREADHVVVRRCGIGDLDPVGSERAEDVLPARQAVLDVGGDPSSLAAPAEPLQGRGSAALLGPGGQDAREQRAARAVGVLVERQVDLAGGTLEELEERLHEALVGEGLEVGEMEGSPRPASDVDHLVDRREQAVALVADMGYERHARTCRLLGHRHELARRGVGTREVDEPEGQHPCARVEAEPNLVAHCHQVLGRGIHAPATEHDVAHRAVADRRDEREGGSGRVERVEILRHRRPRPVLRPRALERPEVRLPLGPPGRVDRRGREPVGVDHLGREPLRELGREEGIVEAAERRVRVQVDEPRAQHQPSRVQDLACRRGPIRVARRHELDRAPAHADVAHERRRVARVDGGAVEEEVEHG